MATAKPSGALSSVMALPAGSTEEEQKLAEVRQAQQALKEALDQRKGFYLDPTMLAIAQGFAAPTRTGNFFESLGNVAGNIGKVQEAEQQRAQEIARMRLELAAGELGQMQKQRLTQQMMNQLGLPTGAPAGEAPAASGVAPGAAPGAAPAASGAAPGAAPAKAAALAPLDETTVARWKLLSPEYGNILEDMLKTQRDRYLISMQGIVFDRVAGKYLNLPIPGQKQEKYETPYGSLMLTPYEYDSLRTAIDEGKGDQWYENWKGAKTGRPGRRTAQEIAAQEAAAETAARKTAEAEVGRTQAGITSGEDVNSRIATYNTLETLAKRPGADKIFGILANPDVSSAILKLVETGIGMPGFSIGIPEIQNALRNVNIPKELISDAQIAGMLMAQAQLQASRLMQGQGAVSDFERRLFSSAAFSMEDRPETIVRKVGLLRARAEFDREVAKALRKSKMSSDDFKDTDDYASMVERYHKKLAGAVSPGTTIRPSAPPAPGQTTQPGSVLRKKLGLE